ncbi:predicted protein [Naegleria gruberi]|uniref:Predicted protein n=1 Tax=Naegleria gruberi TaxID=5762 RepID=D2VBS7_NAEGR|nr:uncharacterized protein NAEGRDRAFT_66319 [Naegleria gruberi]EFC45519.1 predicted protein [Naegleria gruberi]|eukprot:XP_002678263.1 predicted protein [Naegleria gruberi strain NEG-M]
MGTVPVTQEFTDAIDSGMQDVITDTSFSFQYYKLMLFNVPAIEICTTRAKYPTKNPFIGRTQLNMCIELGTIYPHYEVKHLVSKMLVDKINANYKINLKVEYRYLNTSKLGFFATMRQGVDSGYCDMISSNTTPTDERKKVSHFQCSYGTTAQGFLRSGLEPERKLSSLNDLNQTGIIVGAYAGTTYETLVKTKLSAATYVPFYEVNNQYQSINAKSVHALIGDGMFFQ